MFRVDSAIMTGSGILTGFHLNVCVSGLFLPVACFTLAPLFPILPTLPHHTPHLSSLRLQRWVIPSKQITPYHFSDYIPPPPSHSSHCPTECMAEVGPFHFMCCLYLQYLRNLANQSSVFPLLSLSLSWRYFIACISSHL